MSNLLGIYFLSSEAVVLLVSCCLHIKHLKLEMGYVGNVWKVILVTYGRLAGSKVLNMMTRLRWVKVEKFPVIFDY